MIKTIKPAKVSLFDNSKTRYTAAKVKSVTGADIVFNGSLFDMATYRPNCDVKINGVVLNNDPYTYFGYGWKNGELPHVSHTDEMPQLDNYLSCLWAIHNGEKQSLNDNASGIGGVRGRTAFGFTSSGEMVILCTSDSNGAMKLSQARDALCNQGCVNGIILDGGGSSQIDAPDEDILSSRIVSNFVCVWIDKPAKKEDDTLNIIQPNYKWARGAVLRKKTTHIVTHHVGAEGAFTPEQIHAMHLKNGWRGIAYNFYVRKDGSVYHGREENAVGGHTLNYNEVSIGICFEGNFEVEAMPDAQLSAGRELIEYLKPRYPDAKVVRHRDLNATACPGKNFPFEAMINAPKAKSYIYRVQVGAYTVQKNAELIVKDLETKGYKPYIVTEEVKA